MKSLLEFKKYTPVLFVFLFLAAVFASCFFDTRKQDKAEKESQRYDQFLSLLAVIDGKYYEITGCHITGSNPDKTIIPASNSNGVRCISFIIPDSEFFFVYNVDTKEAVVVNAVQNNTKLICKCENSQSPHTGENTWYKRNSIYSNRAEPFFTHTYQKDSNGNIIGVDPFIPTNPGDVFLCNPTCVQNYSAYQKITIQ